jgi:hypothetical protein
LIKKLWYFSEYHSFLLRGNYALMNSLPVRLLPESFAGGSAAAVCGISGTGSGAGTGGSFSEASGALPDF